MKLITIAVEDEEHMKIKLAATKAGLSIKDYLLGQKVARIVNAMPELTVGPQKPTKKNRATQERFEHFLDKSAKKR